MPRSHSRNPSRYVGAEGLILFAKATSQRGFFVCQYEYMEHHPDNRAVLQNPYVSKQKALAHNQRQDGNVHRIANISIEAADDQMSGRKYRGGRTQPFNSKAGERIQQN